MEWIRPKQGRKTVFEITDKGRRKFKEVFAIDALELTKKEGGDKDANL